MLDVKKMSPAEVDLYCGLLHYAYEIQKERTGLVCGTTAEDLRDKMYDSIQTILKPNEEKEQNIQVFKCFFKFDDGATIENKIKHVFLATNNLTCNEIVDAINLTLRLKLCTSNDDAISDLRIIGTNCYDGFVI